MSAAAEDRLMDDAAIGEFFSGSSARTGRRFREEEWTGPVFIVRGRKYIKQSDLLHWLEDRKLDSTNPQPVDLKSTLRSISDRVLRERNKERRAS
jgi:hypothetical protein